MSSRQSRCITRLPSGRFRVRVTIDGRRVGETFSSQAQAQSFVDAVEIDQRLRKHGLPGLIKKRPVLVVMIREFLAEAEERTVNRTLADGTLVVYHQRTAGLLRWLEQELRQPNLQADEFSDSHVTRYLGWRVGRKLSAKASRTPTDVMARKDLALLSRIYRWAGVERRWSIPRNLRRSHGGKRVLPPETFFAFLDAMPTGSVERAYAELAAATGLRDANLRTLRDDQVDLEGGVISVVAAKTRTKLQLPIEPDVVVQLQAYLAQRTIRDVHGHLFVLDGRTIAVGTLRKRFRAASLRVGIDPPIEYIGLARNAFIAYLLESGVDVYGVAQYVGHADVRTTLGYARAYLPLGALRRVASRASELRKGDRQADSRGHAESRKPAESA